MPPTVHRFQKQTIALRELVAGICQSLEGQMSAHAVRVEIDIPPTQTVTADSNMLRQAVANLLVHAIDAMPEGGELAITSAASASAVELEIADSGPGLSEGLHGQSASALCRTSEGTIDLGLAVVCRIAEHHGGKLSAVNCPEGGAAYTLMIPQAKALEKAA